MPEPKPVSCRGFAHLYFAEGEWEPNGRCSIYLYEPLSIEAPADARPSCCYSTEVHFYDCTGNKFLGKVRTHSFMGWSPTLLLVDGTGLWWEVGGGTVVYRNGRWFMRWTLYRNSREAYGANVGMLGWRDPDWALELLRLRGILPAPPAAPAAVNGAAIEVHLL